MVYKHKHYQYNILIRFHCIILLYVYHNIIYILMWFQRNKEKQKRLDPIDFHFWREAIFLRFLTRPYLV